MSTSTHFVPSHTHTHIINVNTIASTISDMILKAKESPNNFKLSAVLMRNRRPIGPIMYNSDRMYIHGKVCPSGHAEANALLNHYGSNLVFSGGKWRILRERAKVCKQV